MGPRQCQVCNEALSKYKCPSCLTPYCSLVCFKKHKEVPCAKPVSSEAESKVASVEPSSPAEKSTGCPVPASGRPYLVDEPSAVLQKSQLESIASSSEIRDALKNEKLQKFIYNINCSLEAENELDRAMEDETFGIFTGKILSALDA